MSTPERNEPVPENEREQKDDKGNSKGKSPSSKAKDLSHVPCKFFKVGACTAGSSCPFSHHVQEPGAQRDVCAWFVKGNCKFGHKCALAHVLPGQPMSMDRKNKKAAQQAAGSGGGKDRSGGRNGKKEGASVSREGAGAGRNPLLASSGAGSSASRAAQGRPPITMPLKASISAPAPAMKDTDFASFGVLDEDKLAAAAPSPVAVAKSISSTGTDEAQAPANLHTTSASSSTPPQPIAGKPASPLPMSSPRKPAQSPRNPPNEFGPIGSPPRAGSVATSPRARNGFASPGTSPGVNGLLSSSPFSSQLAGPRSLGSGLAMGAGQRRPTPSLVGGSIPRLNGFPERVESGDDLEDFIPSSLTDLLTPEERSRRMSRSNSGQGAGAVGTALLAEDTGSNGGGHRYSRSVPAPSLLGDLRNIWSDNKSPAPRTGDGLPGSFTSPSPFAAQQEFGSLGAGSNPGSLLSPSNASAAFLGHGNLHQQFAAKQGIGRGIRNTSNPLMPLTSTHQAPQPAPPPPPAGSHNAGYLSANAQTMSFPESALQAHAPGQSLPQGLAAGYSRMHAMPPSTNPAASPTSAGFSVSHSPGVSNVFPAGPYGGPSASPHASSPLASSPLSNLRNHHHDVGDGVNNLDAMFSKLSYSAATAGRQGGSPMAQRNVSGQGRPGATPLSPLSRPVATGDDDDLFRMDA